MRLITFDQAQGHLKRTITVTSPPSADELDIRLKCDQAEALVIDYVNQRLADGDLWAAEVAAWNVDPEAGPLVAVPGQVSAAVLVQLKELDRFRGDDVDGDEPTRVVGHVLHPRAAAYLYRQRDPAIA